MKNIEQRFGWVGGMLIAMGIIFFVPGGLALFAPEILTMQDAEAVRLSLGLAFGGAGLILLVIGIVILAVSTRNKRRARHLQENGRSIRAQITSVDADYSVRVNGRPCYVVKCSWENNGTTYIFKSPRLRHNPQSYFTRNDVVVFYDPEDMKRYYVDINASLGNVVEL